MLFSMNAVLMTCLHKRSRWAGLLDENSRVRAVAERVPRRRRKTHLQQESSRCTDGENALRISDILTAKRPA